MNAENRNGLLTVVFPDAGKTIQAKPISGRDVQQGGTYLVDTRREADIILQPIGCDILPEGCWQVQK